MTDANNVVTAYSYDPLGHLLSLRVKHPTTASLDSLTAFEYDSEGRVTGITSPQTAKLIVDYSSIGRVTALRSEDGERIDFAYDRMGNVVSRTVKRAGGPATASIKQSYDALGRLLGTTLGGGRPRSLAYDKESNVTAPTRAIFRAARRLMRLGGRLISTIDVRSQRIDYAYDIAGRILSKTPVGRPAS